MEDVGHTFGLVGRAMAKKERSSDEGHVQYVQAGKGGVGVHRSGGDLRETQLSPQVSAGR